MRQPGRNPFSRKAIRARALSACLLLAAFHAPLLSEEIHLKNGDRLSGHIWRIGPSSVLIETAYSTLWVEHVYLEKITVHGTESRARVRPRTGTPFESFLAGATSTELIFRLESGATRRLAWGDVVSVAFLEPETPQSVPGDAAPSGAEKN